MNAINANNATNASFIEYPLMALAVFAPLAFGSVHVWSYSLIEITVFSLLLLALVQALFSGNSTVVFPLVMTPLLIPFALFLLLTLFQLVPLSPAALKVISPATHALYSETLAAVPSVPPTREEQAIARADTHTPSPGRMLPLESTRPVSLYARATREEFFKCLAYFGAFFLLLTVIRTRAQVRRLVLALTIAGVLCALLGIFQLATRTDKIFWFWQSPYKSGDYFGPYVNANHFAGCLELIIPLAIGLMISRPGPFRGAPLSSWKQRLAALESWLTRHLLLLVAIMLMITSLFFSLSRGGIVSFISSMSFMALLLLTRRSRQERRLRLVAATLGLAAVFLLWVGIGPIIKELSTLLDLGKASPGRPIVWKDTMAIVRDFPLLGIGLGCFRYLYPAYRSLPGETQLLHAENDWVELLAETGVVGFVLFFGGLVLTLAVLIRRWVARQDPLAVGIGLGGITSLVAILLHSLVDFNLRIPANALLLFMVLGITVAALYLSLRHGREVSLLPRWELRFRPLSRNVVLAFSSGLFVFCSLLVVKGALADIRFQAHMRSTEQGQAKGARSEERGTASQPPRVPASQHPSPNALRPTPNAQQRPTPNAQQRPTPNAPDSCAPHAPSPVSSFQFPVSILSLDPSNARYHAELGRHYSSLLRETWDQGAWKIVQGTWQFERDPQVREYGLQARAAFARAVALQPTNAWFHLDLGWVSCALEALEAQGAGRAEGVRQKAEGSEHSAQGTVLGGVRRKALGGRDENPASSPNASRPTPNAPESSASPATQPPSVPASQPPSPDASRPTPHAALVHFRLALRLDRTSTAMRKYLGDQEGGKGGALGDRQKALGIRR